MRFWDRIEPGPGLVIAYANVVYSAARNLNIGSNFAPFSPENGCRTIADYCHSIDRSFTGIGAAIFGICFQSLSFSILNCLAKEDGRDVIVKEFCSQSTIFEQI